MTIKEDIMREAGAKLHLIFSDVRSRVVPGIRLSTIDKDVEGLLNYHGARSALKMVGFPGNIAISVNKQVIQGVPDSTLLQGGDLVSLDMTLYYKGFFVDKAISFVLDPQHYAKKYLVTAAKACLDSALLSVVPGITTGQIGAIIQAQAKLLKVRPCRELCGHSIGESHHMLPLIPNMDNGATDVLKAGDFIAIEPIVFYNYYILEHRGYSVTADELSAHFEETVLITDTGAEVLT